MELIAQHALTSTQERSTWINPCLRDCQLWNPDDFTCSTPWFGLSGPRTENCMLWPPLFNHYFNFVPLFNNILHSVSWLTVSVINDGVIDSLRVKASCRELSLAKEEISKPSFSFVIDDYELSLFQIRDKNVFFQCPFHLPYPFFGQQVIIKRCAPKSGAWTFYFMNSYSIIILKRQSSPTMGPLFAAAPLLGHISCLMLTLWRAPEIDCMADD